MTGRLVLGAGGLVVAGYGALLLVSRQDPDQLLSAATWLVAGVLLHDLVVVPLTIALAWAGARLLPRDARGPATVGLVVLGSVTLLSVPVLGRFGARPDDPTLLDRDYTSGWLAVAGLVAVGVAAGSLVVRSRRQGQGRAAEPADGRPDHDATGGTDGAGPGRR